MTTTNIENAKTGLAELGHPAEVNKLAELKSGVVLVSGRHGSGKSVTLGALAVEAQDVSQRRVAEIVANSDTPDLGVPKILIDDRPYKALGNKPKRNDIEAAKAYSLITAAKLIEAGVEVAVFDDIRHVEAGLIAMYLAEAGVLVLASIHNTGDAQNAVKEFTALAGKISPSALSSEIVEAVIHQSLTLADRKTTFMSSAVTYL